jgi:hypothetical protein
MFRRAYAIALHDSADRASEPREHSQGVRRVNSHALLRGHGRSTWAALTELVVFPKVALSLSGSDTGVAEMLLVDGDRVSTTEPGWCSGDVRELMAPSTRAP